MTPAALTPIPAPIPIYPQFDFEDGALKDLSSLLDGEWVWQEYRARFGERDGAPHRIRVRHFSHVPGRRAVVSYVAEWHPDEFIPDEQFAVELRRGKAASLYRYPDDPYLPGLNEAASVESALKLVNRHVLSVPARRVRVDMVRYRPGNRAVLRHRFGRFGFYARVMRPDVVDSLLNAAETYPAFRVRNAAHCRMLARRRCGVAVGDTRQESAAAHTARQPAQS